MADFLSALGAGAGQAAGSQLLPLLASWATGGFKGRPQWRDLEFMNDATNRLFPDEIKRQGQFLEGIAGSQGKALETLAPHQAAAHNTFQDQTFLANVDRETAGIKKMSGELGMSPWELTGQSGSAAPLPSLPQQGSTAQGQSRTGEFLQGLVPLQVAKMQNQTQLAATAMNNQTAKDIEYIRGGGKSEFGGTKLSQAQLDQVKDAAANLRAQTESVNVGTLTNAIMTIYNVAPKWTIDFMGNKLTGVEGDKAILSVLASPTGFTEDERRKAVEKALQSVPASNHARIRQTILEGADKLAQGAQAGMGWAEDVMGQVSKFLGKQK